MPVVTSIINRVSTSLAKLISSRVSLLSVETAIKFDSPAEMLGEGENCLLLYLYQVAMNPFLRNSPATISRKKGASAELTPPPAAVDLMYMVVPWGSVEFEQAVASELIGALNRCGKIPEESLDDVLKKTGNTEIEIVPEPVSIHLLRDLWSMFPQKSYRLTILYKVTPVLLPAEPVDVAMVTQTSLDLHLGGEMNPGPTSLED